jgi:hypothetical protein
VSNAFGNGFGRPLWPKDESPEFIGDLVGRGAFSGTSIVGSFGTVIVKRGGLGKKPVIERIKIPVKMVKGRFNGREIRGREKRGAPAPLMGGL